MKLEYEQSTSSKRVKVELDRSIDKAIAMVVLVVIACVSSLVGLPAHVVHELRALIP